ADRRRRAPELDLAVAERLQHEQHLAPTRERALVLLLEALEVLDEREGLAVALDPRGGAARRLRLAAPRGRRAVRGLRRRPARRLRLAGPRGWLAARGLGRRPARR